MMNLRIFAHHMVTRMDEMMPWHMVHLAASFAGLPATVLDVIAPRFQTHAVSLKEHLTGPMLKSLRVGLLKAHVPLDPDFAKLDYGAMLRSEKHDAERLLGVGKHSPPDSPLPPSPLAVPVPALLVRQQKHRNLTQTGCQSLIHLGWGWGAALTPPPGLEILEAPAPPRPPVLEPLELLEPLEKEKTFFAGFL